MSARHLVPTLLVAALCVLTAAPAVGAPRAADGSRCTVVGTRGDDTLVGTRRADVICGLGGNDVLRGRGGLDLLDGGRGADVVVGGRGGDRLIGGLGRDTLRGGAASDFLLGGDGDDLLLGGDGDDDNRGGNGHDRCPADYRDYHHSCVWDTEEPRAIAWELPEVVDVTDGGQKITIRARLADDIGVSSAQGSLAEREPGGHSLQLEFRRTSGSPRDGWWTSVVTVPRGFPVARLRADAWMTDYAGRNGGAVSSDAVQVLDERPDTAWPQVELLTPEDFTTVDVRSSAANVTARARITDEYTGVADDVAMCLARRDEQGRYFFYVCKDAVRNSGTQHDGIWAVTLPIPKGAAGGDWAVVVVSTDNARPYSHMSTSGRDLLVGNTTQRRQVFLGSVNGVLDVHGTVDSEAPALTGYEDAIPDTVIAQSGPTTLPFTVNATDVEGVTQVRVTLVRTYGDTFLRVPIAGTLALSSGTATSGTWTGSMELPRSSPHGDYYPVITIVDRTHARSYVAAAGADGVIQTSQALPTDAFFTVS